jgi:hypothetical protein
MDTTTLELRRNTPSWHLGVVPDRWERKGDGVIVAAYDPESLAYALACAGQTRAALRILTGLHRAIRLHSEARRLRGL